MHSIIIQTLLDNLPAHRPSVSGWQSFNAPCCDHRGHNHDRRKRGGVKLTTNGVVYNCFKCHYTTGYTVGSGFGIKFRRLLIWLGVSATEVNALKIHALRERELYAEPDTEPSPILEIVPRDLPDHSVLLDQHQHPEYWKYLQNRGLDPAGYSYFVSTELARRVIVPFTFQDNLVGYTARGIGAQRPKYLQSLAMPYIFGADLQHRDWTWCPVMEGVFDALSVGGCATLGNEVSEAQAEQLDALDRTVVIVPDQDRAGDELVQAAIDYGWSVSWCDWPAGIKDVNDAVVQYGALFVTRHIWASRVTGTTQIKLRRKLRKH